ncbi:hypothetical protein DBV15_01667 [Temnothorax longispinosus]|uniref:Uncharacterized protein n=1 Tax=Temnothorax longispinosus TaxID=300112 RepID=A0A4S2L6F7_9HYME|nr:hypothetical protein DBV15_01667 [Temnothorax longispinosus]
MIFYLKKDVFFTWLNRCKPWCFRMYVRQCFRGRSLSEIFGGHVEKRSPLRQADETTTDKATLPKSDYGRSEHPCDVVTDSDDGSDYDDRFYIFGIAETQPLPVVQRSTKYFPRGGRLPINIAIDASLSSSEINSDASSRVNTRQKFSLEVSLPEKEFATTAIQGVPLPGKLNFPKVSGTRRSRNTTKAATANRPPDPDNERVLRAASGFIEFVSSGTSSPATPLPAPGTRTPCSSTADRMSVADMSEISAPDNAALFVEDAAAAVVGDAAAVVAADCKSTASMDAHCKAAVSSYRAAFDCTRHLDVEVALASCFDLHVADPQVWVMDRVRLAVVDHLLCLNNAETFQALRQKSPDAHPRILLKYGKYLVLPDHS